MIDFAMKLAGIPFGVRCQFASTKQFCREYLTEDAPRFTVEIAPEDIDREREISRQQDIRDGIPIRVFSDAYLETIALYRKIAEPLLQRHCIIFHGAVVAVDGEGYLFTAKSGTGKTTHIKLWTENIPNSYILNGDKPLIKIENGVIIVYGTPWRGKEYYGINEMLPLKALCILGRGRENQISEITPSKAFPILYQQVHHMETVEGMETTMELLGVMANCVPLYRLYCNMEKDAALVSYGAMSGREKKSVGEKP